MIVLGDQGEGHRHVTERVGGQQEREPSQVRLIDAEHAAEALQHLAAVRGHVEGGGTGKELVASALHRHSRRSGGPLLAVNCGALPEGLIESELFGHERGAFTGADRQKPGRFERAAGGSIFLDEIGELPLAAQARLLRVIQDRQFERVGGTITLRANVRIISATHRDLPREIAAGRFREDLYYRLNAVAISLPPLRERLEDIPLLAEHILRRLERKYGWADLSLSD